MDGIEKNNPELNHLFWKDEILQVMYWMFGEKLGAQVSIQELVALLNSPEENLSLHILILLEDGYLTSINKEDKNYYQLTEMGKREAGQRFAGAFQGLQKAGHGECGPDCDCQWEGKESCHHHIHDKNCNH